MPLGHAPSTSNFGIRRSAFGLRISSSYGAKASMPLIILLDSGVELGFSEIGPKRRRDDQLGVGDLPEQKVANAHLAAGADQQIRVGNITRVKVLRNNLLGDFGGVELSGFDLLGDAPHGIDDLRAATVAQGHD